MSKGWRNEALLTIIVQKISDVIGVFQGLQSNMTKADQ